MNTTNTYIKLKSPHAEDEAFVNIEFLLTEGIPSGPDGEDMILLTQDTFHTNGDKIIVDRPADPHGLVKAFEMAWDKVREREEDPERWFGNVEPCGIYFPSTKRVELHSHPDNLVGDIYTYNVRCIPFVEINSPDALISLELLTFEDMTVNDPQDTELPESR